MTGDEQTTPGEMTRTVDETCDPLLRSWIESANSAETDFPVQNLPFGVFRRGGDAQASVGVAIGDRIADLRGLADAGLLAGLAGTTADACRAETLNPLMALGADAVTALRHRLSSYLREDVDVSTRMVMEEHLTAQSEAEMVLPVAIGDYTDFYASIEHATRVGAIFRPERPLLPNYKHIPIGYHGRASSIVVSGTPVRRPRGQRIVEEAPVFAATARLDYEVELGLYIGRGNALGEPVSMEAAPQHMFGCCLVNDWSARDVQAWEYQPLGPFLGKNFATSLSAWVVTMQALQPFRVAARQRAEDDPPLLPYLQDKNDRDENDTALGGVDARLEVQLRTAQMRAAGTAAVVLSQSTAANLYWTLSQMLTHHTSNGCNLRAGDLLATGTVSGVEEAAGGCLLERTRGGVDRLLLPNGETRAFLEDGDEVILRGFCVREGARRIGFGECRGVVVG